MGGCSSIAVTKPMADEDNRPIVVNYCVESTAEMNVINKSLTGEENKARFDRRISSAVTDIHDYLAAHMVKSPRLQMVERSSCAAPVSSRNPEASLDLTVDVSGYGSIKPKWKTWLIGSGAVEAVFQGAVVTSVTQNPWLGLAVGTEEMTSEYLTWNGVDWLLGETYAPVTLEGKLIYAKNNKVIWQDSYFVTENDDELAKLGNAEKKEKGRQLQASLHKAERKLFASLDSYLNKQVL